MRAIACAILGALTLAAASGAAVAKDMSAEDMAGMGMSHAPAAKHGHAVGASRPSTPRPGP